MMNRATTQALIVALTSLLWTACEPETPPQPTPATHTIPLEDVAAEPTDVVAIEEKAASQAAVEPRVPGPNPVTDPSVAILGAWSGLRYETVHGHGAAAGKKLANTMLVQFTEETMTVTLGLTGTVSGPWTPARARENRLDVVRKSPSPEQTFSIQFHGRDEMTMSVSSTQRVRFARATPRPTPKAPSTPTPPQDAK
jgi:hypothetical protein